MTAPRDPAFRARLIRALVASTVTGLVILTAMRVGLPAVARRLTNEQVDWLRRSSAEHPWIVMATLTLIAAGAALPVLVAFRLAFGPMKGQWRRPLR
jgi:hypothetical protein